MRSANTLNCISAEPPTEMSNRGSDLVRQLFQTVVTRRLAEGLAGGERIAADASLVRVEASKQNAAPVGDWSPEQLDPLKAPRAAREHLDTPDDAASGAASELKPRGYPREPPRKVLRSIHTFTGRPASSDP